MIRSCPLLESTPNAATPLIDAALLQLGDPDNIGEIYKRRHGQSIWSDWFTGRDLTLNRFSMAFKQHTGHSPHIMRDLVEAFFAEHGSNPQQIALMLQHKSTSSQKEYQAASEKIRLRAGMQELARIQEEL